MLPPIVKTIPTCHPERPHKARGLCRNCYKKMYDKYYDGEVDARSKCKTTRKEIEERKEWQAKDAEMYPILKELRIKAEIAEVMREDINRSWGKYTISNEWSHLGGE